MPLRARALIDQFPSPAAVLEGPDHVYTATSAAYRRLIGGVDPAGRPLREVLPGLVQSGFVELLDRVYRTGEPEYGQSTPARWDSDGDGKMEERFVDFVYSPIRSDEGKIRGILVHVSDVTERVRREREMRFLFDASNVLASSLDYETTLTAVTRLAVEAIADWCAVDELAPDGGVRRIAVAHPDPAKIELAYELQEKYPPDPNATLGVPQVIRTGQPEFLAEIPDELLVAATRDEEHLRLARELGLRSYICVPLTARGNVLGALTLVGAESGRRYSEEDVRFAELLARRAAIAIDNARLYRDSEDARVRSEESAIELEAQAEELQSIQVELETTNIELQEANSELELRADEAERSRVAAEAARARLERLQAVTAALSDVISPRKVAEIGLKNATALFGARTATFACLDAQGSHLEVLHAVGYPEELLERFRRFPVAAPLPLSDAVREQRAVYIASREERERLYAQLARELPATEQQAWASIPMLVESRVLGGIGLGFGEPRAFSADERAFLEALAQQCAQALERARLFEAERKVRDRMELLADAGALLASSLDVDSTLRDLSHLLVPRVCDWCFIEMPDGEGGIAPVAVHHRDPELVEYVGEALRRYPVDPEATFGTGQVLRSGEPEVVVEIPDEFVEMAARDEGHAEALRHLGFRSYMCVPLHVRGRTIGVLSLVMADSGRRFQEDDLSFALELARRASTAIDNASLYEAERRARTEAEEANQAKTEFLSAMSHELRTPLNAIAGYVDLLDFEIHGPLTIQQRESLARIKRNQEILLGLISDVLNFARVEAGRIEFSSGPVPIEPLLEGLEEVIGPQVRGQGLTYRHLVAASDLVALGDPDRIQQILLNLLTNAVKFTDPGGAISVVAEGADSSVVIRVSDTGRGIPADKLEAIFDPFVQVDRHRTDRSQQGVGLGLAISRDLARAMGGDLHAESVPDAGSTFSVVLPRAP